MYQPKQHEGFTLIELMIVVAIIAILAAIALPAYQDYVIRSQVSEGAVIADSAKDGVWNYVAMYGKMPTGNTQAGIPKPKSITGKFVGEIEVQNGIITVTYSSSSPQRANEKIDGKTLVFSPTFTPGSGSVVWKCQPTGTVPEHYLPTICRKGTN